LESIVATRVSLIRSVRLREQREQIGSLTSDFTHDLSRIESACLIELSARARFADRPQIALNSIVKAQKLTSVPDANASREFANVLWLQGEHKAAVLTLKRLLGRRTLDEEIGEGDPGDDALTKALMLAQVVCNCFQSSVMSHNRTARENGPPKPAWRNLKISTCAISHLQ